MVTGAMALRWLRASASDLEHWARELRAIAAGMEASAAVAPAAANDIPDWLLQATEAPDYATD
jgi:hypothetical protein